jgi:FAD/FMN-containing dehydrogenase
LFKAVDNHFINVPSEKTLVMFALFTGANVPAPLPDACFSMSAKLYGGPWTMWDQSADDQSNLDWHDKCVQLLKPFVAGHYVSETDTVGHPAYAKDSYKEANWHRLAELRKKYDPDGVFFNFSDGLS